MNAQLKASALTYGLALLAVSLLVLTLMQGWRGSNAVSILRAPPRKIVVPSLPSALNLPNDFQIIRDQALFYATRKFYSPAPAMPPTMRAELSNYQLIGTMLVPHGPAIAFLQTGPGGTTTKVSPGDHLGGWIVINVQSGKVVFGYNNQRVTLKTPVPFASSPAAPGTGMMRAPIIPFAQHASPAYAPQRLVQPLNRSPHGPPSP
jgi:hypothetical protein